VVEDLHVRRRRLLVGLELVQIRRHRRLLHH
jgi:hypothetical protein